MNDQFTETQIDRLPNPCPEWMHRWETPSWSTWLDANTGNSLARVLRPPPKPDEGMKDDLRLLNVPEHVIKFVGRNEASRLKIDVEANWREYSREQAFRLTPNFQPVQTYAIDGQVRVPTEHLLPVDRPNLCSVSTDLNFRVQAARQQNDLLTSILFEPDDAIHGGVRAMDYGRAVASLVGSTLGAGTATYSSEVQLPQPDGKDVRVGRYVSALIPRGTELDARKWIQVMGFPPPSLLVTNGGRFAAFWRLIHPVGFLDARRLADALHQALAYRPMSNAADGYALACKVPGGHEVPMIVGAVYKDRWSAPMLWDLCQRAIERRITLVLR